LFLLKNIYNTKFKLLNEIIKNVIILFILTLNNKINIEHYCAAFNKYCRGDSEKTLNK